MLNHRTFRRLSGQKSQWPPQMVGRALVTLLLLFAAGSLVGCGASLDDLTSSGLVADETGAGAPTYRASSGGSVPYVKAGDAVVVLPTSTIGADKSGPDASPSVQSARDVARPAKANETAARSPPPTVLAFSTEWGNLFDTGSSRSAMPFAKAGDTIAGHTNLTETATKNGLALRPDEVSSGDATQSTKVGAPPARSTPATKRAGTPRNPFDMRSTHGVLRIAEAGDAGTEQAAATNVARRRASVAPLDMVPTRNTRRTTGSGEPATRSAAPTKSTVTTPTTRHFDVGATRGAMQFAEAGDHLTGQASAYRYTTDSKASSGAVSGGDKTWKTKSHAKSAPRRTPTATVYKIGSQDVLEIEVFKVPELSKTVQVAGNGTVNLPLLGEVPAAGKTRRDFERGLTAMLGEKYLQNPQVTVSVKQYNSQKVTVEGAVKKPGVYALQGPTSLLQVIAMAQGLDKNSDSTVVLLRTTNGKRAAERFDIHTVRAGDTADPILQPGDMVLAGTSAVKEMMETFKGLPLGLLLSALL